MKLKHQQPHHPITLEQYAQQSKLLHALNKQRHEDTPAPEPSTPRKPIPPKQETHQCKCGCGTTIPIDNQWANGHNIAYAYKQNPPKLGDNKQ